MEGRHSQRPAWSCYSIKACFLLFFFQKAVLELNLEDNCVSSTLLTSRKGVGNSSGERDVHRSGNFRSLCMHFLVINLWVVAQDGHSPRVKGGGVSYSNPRLNEEGKRLHDMKGVQQFEKMY